MANYYIMPDSLEQGRRKTSSRFQERDHRSLSRRIEDIKRELKETEDLFKKKEEPKKNQLSNFELAFTLCLGTMILGPFILWAQVVALSHLAQSFQH